MREKIRNQASTVNHGQAIRSSYTLNQSPQRVAVKTWIVTLAVSLGLAGSLWFTTETNTTQIAQAETFNVGLAIDRRQNETYESLVSRAEALAKAAVEESFDQNQEATDVSITVVARYHGAIAPVVSLKVSRDEWSRTDAKRWITHFNQARSLLRFDNDVADTNSNSNQPQTNNPRPAPQSRGTNTTPSQQRGNSGTSSNRQGVSGTFSQPGSPVASPVPGQNTNNVSPGQPSNANTNPPVGQNAPGNGLTPQPPATPAASPNQQQNVTPPEGANLTPQPPAVPNTLTPAGSPQNPTQLNNTSPGFPTNSTTTPTNNSQSGTPLNNASPSGSATSNPLNTQP